jgi:hypothetical protein
LLVSRGHQITESLLLRLANFRDELEALQVTIHAVETAA